MRLLTVLALTFVSIAHAQQPAASNDADFDSLGGNKILLERAKALEPDKNVSIVQSRTVDRRHRVEIAPEFGGTFGGETYSRTRTVGLNAYYHFTPRFSLGLKYNYAFNSLTPEGEAVVDKAIEDYNRDPANPNTPYPELDYARSEMLALFNWFPIYGKLNLMDRSVVQFDVYMVGGGGQIELRSGPTTTYTAGGGIGFWFSRNFSTRVEMRYQNYTAQYFTGERDLDLTVGSVQMGWML